MRALVLPKKAGWILVVALVTLLPSCGPASKNPLGSPEKSKPDEGLFGVWQGTDDKEAVYLFIGAAPHGPDIPPGLMCAQFVSYKTHNHELVALGPVFFFPSQGGGTHFANVYQLRDAEGLAPPKKGLDLRGPFFLAKYTVDKDKLTACFMDNQAAERAVKDGRLKGTTEGQGIGRRVLLTDTTERLAKFLQDGGEKELFPESQKATFSRLR